MGIAKKAMAAVASAGVAVGAFAVMASPAAAVDPEVVTAKLQVFSDDTNLDAYDGVQVWTRDP